MENLSAMPDTSTGPIDQRLMRFSEGLNNLNSKLRRKGKAPLFEDEADLSNSVSAPAGFRREIAVLKADLQGKEDKS
nr:hypothetical protein [uncultured Cohaesibacter sp.]